MFAGGEVDRLKGLKWYLDGEFLGYSKRGQESDPDEKGIVTDEGERVRVGRRGQESDPDEKGGFDQS